jgi:transketolase
MNSIDQLAVNTIRILAAEGIQKANSGHPGMPMGMADVAYVLWTKYLKFNPEKPDWINRDRFVLSAGHGSMLLYSLLHLSHFDVTMDDLKSFRQLNSRTPGHPEYGCLPGVETTTGPLGQGFANAVGMSIASKMMKAKFDDNNGLFGEHFVYAICGDGDLMEGISSEAASLAGHLGLGNIIFFYDDNKITIDGSTDLAFTEDVQKRFDAYGWHTIKIDGHNHDEIKKAIELGQAEKNRPTLILARTTIGYGSPNKSNTSGVHGSPLGKDELQKTKENLGWKFTEEFFIPNEVKKIFSDRINLLKKEYSLWCEQYEQWKRENTDKAALLKKYLTKEIPENILEKIYDDNLLKENATRAHSGFVMQKISSEIPFLVGGSADLNPSTNTFLKNSNAIQKNSFEGSNIYFGIREHAMGGILNGISLYGGFIPFGSTFLVFSDYMRPSIRLAALSKLQVIYVFTHDSIFLGEDGPTHQPIEHLAALRTIPNLKVIRPADGYETALAWAEALKNTTGPTAIILTRQKVKNVSSVEKSLTEIPDTIEVYKNENGKRKLVILASGSEVYPAIESAKILSNDYSVKVLSVLSLNVLKSEDNSLNKFIPKDAKCVVVEAAITTGWGDIVRNELLRIDLNDFGKSAPTEVLAEYYGFTAEKIATKIKNWLN